jgi:hypothetical protein
MDPVWTLAATPRVNREGNQVELDFMITGLGFIPRYNQSEIFIPTGTLPDDTPVPNDYGPLVGWRANGAQFRQFIRGDDTVPDDEPKLFSGAVYSITGTTSLAAVKVALRLMSRAQVSPGADSRPSAPAPATWIVQLPTGFVRVAPNGSVTPTQSPQFLFSDDWDGLNLSAAAENVGKLPGWNGAVGAPTLRLQCDSFAERSQREIGDTPVDEAIDGWADLRSTSPNNLTQALPAGQPVLFANTTTPPELRFFKPAESKGSLLGHTADYDLVQSSCAFGVVFRADAGTTTTTQHLIGRWSASPPTDNASTRQWRLIYERTAGTPPTHRIKAQFVGPGSSYTVNTLESTIDAPTAKTIVVYRVNTSGTPTGELWVNGVLVASTTTLHTGANTGANTRLTVGGRYAALVDADNPATNPLIGSMDQCFIYSTSISDATLSAVHHELARRAGIKLGPVPQPNLTQPYGESNPEPYRRLDRWPVGLINLFGGTSYDANPLSQVTNWRRSDGNRQTIVDWFHERIIRILNACPDFEIMINRPQGNYRNDIIAAGIFGDIDGDPGNKIIKDFQWQALLGWTDGGGGAGVYSEWKLSDHNNRDNRCSEDDADFARRCWIYTGNPTINDDGAVTQDARVGARNLSPCSASFYKEEFLDRWVVKDDRFRCFFVDSASKWDRKWIEILHTPSVNEEFTLIGEAITTDPDLRKGAPWFCFFGFAQTPWWVPATSPEKGYRYVWQWSAGAWDQTPIYIGINRVLETGDNAGVVIDLNRPVDAGEQARLRFEDSYRVCNAGAMPIAWDGDYQKVGAAWYYGGRRIPVGRFTMLSPRISRVWR